MLDITIRKTRRRTTLELMFSKREITLDGLNYTNIDLEIETFEYKIYCSDCKIRMEVPETFKSLVKSINS